MVKSPAWNKRKSEWFTHDSHNSLRSTRILKSLTLLGLPDEAHEFQRALERLCATEVDCGVNSVSQGF